MTDTAPELPAFSFFQAEQRYMPRRVVDHPTRDGRTVKLIELATSCATCGAAFTVCQPLGGAKYLTRNCPQCRGRR